MTRRTSQELPHRFLLGSLLLGLFCVSHCDARSSSGMPLAAIFGFGGNKEEPEPQPLPPRPFPRGQGPPPRGIQAGGQARPPPPGQGMQQNIPPGRPPLPHARPLLPQQHQQQQAALPKRPPPPPPPPGRKGPTVATQSKGGVKELEKNSAEVAIEEEATGTLASGLNQYTEGNEEAVQDEPAGEDATSRDQVQPPPPQWFGDPYQEQAPQRWMSPPPPEYNQWEAPDPNFQGWQAPQYYGDQSMYLQGELDESLAHETELVLQLDNLTASVTVMTQREELHVRQLDVLTERIMDVEAQAAADRNSLIEYEANCTALGLSIGSLQEELEDWQRRCAEFSEVSELNEQKISELKRTIKAKQSEAEDLAIAIESLRLAEKEKEDSNSRRKRKKTGLFSWLFSWLVSSSDDEYQEFTREEAFEMAKSTLLRALQTERSNVHELETAVASLQQNNSAIAEMVDSRDMIIDELNNRIAVFEEDKVVLKAALRQLQKEMKEEAPKTQKLLEDLADAKKESKRLNAEINSIISTHQEELNSLILKISTKQKTISERESNLTAIGTYVDKLEERLTSFAVTRRDIEVREKKCKEIEESALKTEAEMEQLLVKVSDYEGEQVELKKLLQELALERTTLQKDNRKLLTEREFRIGEDEQMQARTASLEAQVQSLKDYLHESQMKIDELAPALEASKGANADLQVHVTMIYDLESELECLKSDNAQLREECEKAMTGFRNVQEELRVALDEKKRAEDEKVALDVKKRAEDETFALGEKIRAEDEKVALDEKKRAEDENAKLLSRLAEYTTSKDTDGTDSDEEKESQSQQSGGGEPPIQPVRNVPLRTLRKKISKATGLHGILTPSSKMGQMDKKLQPGRGPKGELSRMPNVRPLPKGVPTQKGQPRFAHTGQPPIPPPPLP